MKLLFFASTVLLLSSCGSNQASPEEIAEKHANNYCECFKETEVKKGEGSPIPCYEEHITNLDKELDKADFSDEETEKAEELFQNIKTKCENE